MGGGGRNNPILNRGMNFFGLCNVRGWGGGNNNNNNNFPNYPNYDYGSTTYNNYNDNYGFDTIPSYSDYGF